MNFTDYIFNVLVATLYEYTEQFNTTYLISKKTSLEKAEPKFDMPRSVPRNLSKEILYESFISMDSVVFLTETRHMTSNALKEFLKSTVLAIKQKLLTDFSIFKHISNYSVKVADKESGVEKAIRLRNKAFSEDKSQIAKALSASRYQELKAQINKNMHLFNDTQDIQYLEMMERLRQVTKESKNVRLAINREKYEFYREKCNIDLSELLEVKINLSLGGSIFMPKLLLSVMKSISIASKHDMVLRVVSTLIKPIEKLESNIRFKSFIDAKQETINFLTSCLERRDGIYKYEIDQAFAERSNVLNVLLRDDPLIRAKMEGIDRIQEKEIKKMIRMLESSNEENLRWIVKVNSDITESYIELLDTLQEKNIRKVLSYFE